MCVSSRPNGHFATPTLVFGRQSSRFALLRKRSEIMRFVEARGSLSVTTRVLCRQRHAFRAPGRLSPFPPLLRRRCGDSLPAPPSATGRLTPLPPLRPRGPPPRVARCSLRRASLQARSAQELRCAAPPSERRAAVGLGGRSNLHLNGPQDPYPRSDKPSCETLPQW